MAGEKKKFHRSATGQKIYDYPVEILWRALMGDSTRNLIDPISEENYAKDPKPGTIYTRSLEVVLNERFSFEMKTTLYIAAWYVELERMGECETRVTVTEKVEFNGLKSLALCQFGLNLGHEINYFINDLDRKLYNYDRKMKIGR